MSASKIFIIELMVDEFTEMVMPTATRSGVLKLIKKFEDILKKAIEKKQMSTVVFMQKKISSLKKVLPTLPR